MKKHHKKHHTKKSSRLSKFKAEIRRLLKKKS
jgi:hypothetical protein